MEIYVIGIFKNCFFHHSKYLPMFDSDELKDVQRAVVILHALVTAADLLIQCCMQSAISHLGQVQAKHKDLLGSMLIFHLQNSQLKLQVKD